MNKKLNRVMNFKGSKGKSKYFEGWYYKMVSEDKKSTLSLIPGISLNAKNPHAFIQMILNDVELNDLITEYFVYDIDSFNFNRKISTLFIDKSSFNPQKISVNCETEKFKIHGEITNSNLKPIKTSILSPSIMGLFQYLPFMECYHSVVSMNHNLKGSISINNKQIDFTGGKGYIEKDYGRSFPEKYVWLQSNNFSDKDTSLMLSIATIPYLGLKFKGLIVNLIIKNREYRFATYNMSKLKKLESSKNKIHVIIKKRKYRLEIEATNKEVKDLPSPRDGVMDQSIKEGLSGSVEVVLYYKNKIFFRDTGMCAGLEIML